mgnify:CR=1 FL=1
MATDRVGTQPVYYRDVQGVLAFGPGEFDAATDEPGTPGERRLAAAWAEYTGRLQDNYPFFHPRYAGQMLKPPAPVAWAAYATAMPAYARTL